MTKLSEITTPQEFSLEQLVNLIVVKIKETTPEPILYDLGAGQNPFDGFLGVDINGEADVKHDLFNGDWSFCADESVDMLFSSHFLEHVPDLYDFMEKAYRKLKVGGYFFATTPWGASDRAWQDPDHKRPIFDKTYWYFNKKSRKNMRVDHYTFDGKPLTSNFQMVGVWPAWNDRFRHAAEGNPTQAEYLMRFQWNALEDMSVCLKKLAPDED